MKQYGVLVVDDSSFMRRCISLLLEKDPAFFILGIARNGQDALEKVQRLKPDIVTMDVEMPEMDGITSLERIMKTCPVPVVMLSSYTEEGAKTSLQALELGAVDVFLKSELIGDGANEKAVENFLLSLKTFAEKGKLPTPAAKESLPIEQTRNELFIDSKEIELLIIGCSTGGPSALQSLLPRFPRGLRIPIIVIQHMPPGFTGPLAERFNSLCNLPVKEITDGDSLEPGVIYIAPAGFQTYIKKNTEGSAIFSVNEFSPIETLYKPSINVTVLSAAQIFNERLLTVILTGMGNDGLLGCQEVKKRKGKVIVEAEESCIVYGMPKVVFEAGLADIQVPLPSIFEQIMLMLRS